MLWYPAGKPRSVEIGPASHFKPADFTVLARRRQDGQPFFLARAWSRRCAPSAVKMAEMGRQSSCTQARPTVIGRELTSACRHVGLMRQIVLSLLSGRYCYTALDRCLYGRWPYETDVNMRNRVASVKTISALLRVGVGLDAGTQRQCQTGKGVKQYPLACPAGCKRCLSP